MVETVTIATFVYLTIIQLRQLTVTPHQTRQLLLVSPTIKPARQLLLVSRIINYQTRQLCITRVINWHILARTRH